MSLFGSGYAGLGPLKPAQTYPTEPAVAGRFPPTRKG